MPNSFGLPADATPDEVKRRWRELAQQNHPDHGGDPVKFQALHKEYRRLLEIAEEPRSCHRCGGSGKIKAGSGFSYINIDCPDCGGTGKE